MSRRRRTSLADDLLEVISRLPWWAGIGLAIVSYVVLHRVASQPVVTALQPGQLGAMVTSTIWKSLASGGQYLLPFICLVGAGVSAWRRRKRTALFETAAQSNAASALDHMSWRQFEQLVSEAFRRQGYAVVENGGGGADGGIDLTLTKGREKYLVQCKQWRAYKVGVNVVRELYGVMAAKGAAGGFVVTSGRFTEEATAFADGRNVRLIDGRSLHGLIRQAAEVSRSESAETLRPVLYSNDHEKALPLTPNCPMCNRPMVKRLARRGPNQGGEFFGCTGYPACKGTRSAA